MYFVFVIVCFQKRCCGVDGPWDYAETEWFNEMNPYDDVRPTEFYK